MDCFQLAHSSGAGWEECTRNCLDQIGPEPMGANLGFVYVTDALAPALREIVEVLRASTGVEHWTGTAGAGICCSGHEYYDEPALAVMLAHFPDEQFRLLPGIRAGLEPLRARLASWYRSHPAHFAVVHGDPRNQLLPGLVGALAEELPGGYLVGGISSSSDQFPQVAEEVSEGGLSGVAFSDRVSVVTALTQGCSPIGAKHVINECERNVAVRIDDRPALDVFKEDIGEILARDLNRVAGYIFAGLPIAGSDRDDYLVRNVIGVDVKNKLLGVGEMLEPGQQIMFCRRDAQTALEDLHRMLRDLRRRTPHPPRGGLYFTCLGRGRNLFGRDSEELRIIADELGEFPLVGFFANGEISNNRLYGYTGVLSLFL